VCKYRYIKRTFTVPLLELLTDQNEFANLLIDASVVFFMAVCGNGYISIIKRGLNNSASLRWFQRYRTL
jgi:hypothetical protein